MKVWKLVSGILSIILFVFVSFQSCAAGVSNALEANGEVSGSAAIIGFAGYGSFSDLAIWAGWCLINAVLAVVALVMAKKNN